MAFYQNPFIGTFKGHWPLRSTVNSKQQSLILEGRENSGRGVDLVMAWASGPYDLSGNDAEGDANRYLNIKLTTDFTNWSQISLDLGVSATTTATQVVTALMANSTFNSFFSAALENNKLIIRQRLPAGRFRFFVVNGQAETVLKFNARAGVFEMPVYMNRHLVGGTESDCLHTLVALDPSNDVDAAVIESATDHRGNLLGYDKDIVKADWQHLAGSTSIFLFKKNTVDGSNRITQSIIYPAGSGAGDLATKIVYTFAGANTAPSTVFELPYTLESGDLITP
jgi:uncharacterized ubiquitin-like protein YukD